MGFQLRNSLDWWVKPPDFWLPSTSATLQVHSKEWTSSWRPRTGRILLHMEGGNLASEVQGLQVSCAPLKLIQDDSYMVTKITWVPFQSLESLGCEFESSDGGGVSHLMMTHCKKWERNHLLILTILILSPVLVSPKTVFSAIGWLRRCHTGDTTASARSGWASCHRRHLCEHRSHGHGRSQHDGGEDAWGPDQDSCWEQGLL